MRRRLQAVGVAFAVVAAGGLAYWYFPDEGPPELGPEPPPPFGVVSHNRTGLLDHAPPGFASLNVTLKSVGKPGSEPTIGVTAIGSLFVTGGSATVWRSQDGGERWIDVTNRTLKVDQDPYVWVDPLTDRVYSVPGGLSCSDIRWSDDDGGHWNGTRPIIPIGLPVENPAPRGGCGDGGHDHQSLVAGPPPGGGRLDTYPNMVYYAYNDRPPATGVSPREGAWMSRSLDGGLSFESVSYKIFPSDCQQGLTGVPAVTPNGTVYVPKAGCTSLRIAVSYDGGKEWTITDIDKHGIGGNSPTALGSPTQSPNPGIAIDGAGNAYALWAGDGGGLHLARSTDGGATWNGNTSVNATPPGLNQTAFGAIVAGEPGRIAFAYLATTVNATGPYRDAHFVPAGTPWHLYIAWSLDALSDDPTFTTIRATPDTDPVHLGPIWQAGDAGANSQGRQLGDFLGMTRRGEDAYVSFADSCSNNCTAPAESATLWVAIPTGAPALARAS